MKTRNFIAAAIIMLFTVCSSVYSQGNNLITNVSKTSDGTTKEVIKMDESSNTPISKVVYIYNNEELCISKIFLTWDSRSGWQNDKKIDMEYSVGKKISSMTTVKWDKRADKWSNKMERLTYSYDADGNIASTDYHEIESTGYNS